MTKGTSAGPEKYEQAIDDFEEYIVWMMVDRAVLAFSLTATAYCAFLALNFYIFKLDFRQLGFVGTLVGVVVEIVTFPLFFAVAAAFLFAVGRLLMNRQCMNACNLSSVLVLFGLNCFIWGSFVF